MPFIRSPILLVGISLIFAMDVLSYDWVGQIMEEMSIIIKTREII